VTFRVTVPASSANLGPGFDSIGVALSLTLEAEVAPAERFEMRFHPGRYAPTNPSFAHEIERGLRTVFGGGALPSVSLQISNAIPLGKGLGASAAGAVLGLCIAQRLSPQPPHLKALARLACELEGHPDNALPALLGGIVVAAQAPDDATPTMLRFAPPKGLRAVVAVPQIVLPTAAARALLPAHYERRDVVYNLQRAALLAASLASGDLTGLREASRDRVHQPYRAPLVPGFNEMLELELPGLLSVALSGAGPSVLALVSGNDLVIGQSMKAAFAREGVESEIFQLEITMSGATITEIVAISEVREAGHANEASR